MSDINEPREPILVVATGQKKVGKTFTTTRMIEQYIRPNPENGKEGRKVLIYDVNMEYTQFRAIALKDVKKFTLQNKVEVRRVLPRLEDGSIAKMDEMMAIMGEILDSFAGGLLVLEDINRYLIGTQTQDIIGTITTNRHRDLDIMIHLQSLAALTPRLWQNTSVIRFHKQQDLIDRYKTRIPYFEQLKVAEFLVNSQYFKGNERFFCYVSGEEGYIRGEFSKLSLIDACKEYVEQYATNSEIKKFEIKYKKDPNSRQLAVNDIATIIAKKYSR